MTSFRRILIALALVLVLPSAVPAASVEVSGTPFPSDIFTVPDASQLTGVRVNLPKPDCGVRPSDCADIDVLNTLDGFNLQPRISIAFTGPIDPASVSSATVFLVSIGCNICGPGGKVIGINQAAWEPAANTLHVESDEFLNQHSRYLLVVTRGVRDVDGKPIGVTNFRHHLNFGQTEDPELKAYRKALLDALDSTGVEPGDIAGVSLFTTQSVTAMLEKIRGQIEASTPAAATMHGTFARSTVTSITWKRQVGTAPTFTTSSVPISLLNPLAVGAIALGQYESPDYETSLKFFPPIGTLTGVPAVQSTNTLQFTLVLPTAPAPPGGYPVVIFGHGFTDSKQGAPIAVAGTLAANGLASIAINVVGHGGGAAGTLTVNRVAAPSVTVPDGGRGIDQDGDGDIESTEGVNAVAPLIGSRDGLRQTVVDLMQLVRLVQTGGIAGLTPTRIYYAGQSFGGIYGTILLGVEPALRAGVPNVPGGPIIEIARLSPAFRGLVGFSLATRTPSLLNTGPLAPPTWGFNENIPLRDEAVRIDTVAGASAIQKVIDDTEWVSQSGNPVAYAPYIRKSPLTGDGTPVIFQFAKGDRTVPNPTTTAILRAGDVADRTSYFRADLWAPGANPHTYLTFSLGVTPAIQAQTQMAIFFTSDGAITVDPDGAGPFFEVPIAGPLPEELNF